ncbi:MAG: hypothetical protein AAGA68_10140 [Pseudomonadota bacterium]
MNGRNVALVGCIAVVAVIALAVASHIRTRVSWYHVGDTLYVDNLLLTCFAGTPVYTRRSGPIGIDVSEPIFSRLEVYLACIAAERFEDSALEERALIIGEGSEMPTLVRLVDRHSWCRHPNFSPTQRNHCRTANQKAVDWMLHRGAEISPANGCVFLLGAFRALDTEMFAFLLSRGADPKWTCRNALVSDAPMTVIEALESLLSEYRMPLDEEEEWSLSPDNDKAYVDMIESARKYRDEA